ncbi:ArsR/SmtB family transcription factor [Paenibacillus protaetiae]|uniref:Transcriptional regulator n=1 Tax=Paenibacillus protaetiae TaxID=2509456 RepID=A0A4P6EXT9_9BACL|nr:helix-turn-helix transcriptional regulator [Paenibacillus protaetiae]QAY66569.1 transcriptional regulator [Paenibacillus protaetiae]
MKPLYHPATEDIQLTSVLYALSDPVRLSIVKQVMAFGEQACGDISIPVAKSTMSHHSKTLREAGIIQTRVMGTQRLLSIRHEDLEARFPGLLEAVMSNAPSVEEISSGND